MDLLIAVHKQVLDAPTETVLQQYEFYLQVFKTTAKEKLINQEVIFAVTTFRRHCLICTKSQRETHQLRGICIVTTFHRIFFYLYQQPMRNSSTKKYLLLLPLFIELF